MNTPIRSLVDVLEEVQEKAKYYRDQLQGNETATRSTLIDPILRALGWDVADPSRVSVASTNTNPKSNQRTIADYALRASDQEIVFLVEAKKLGSNLSDGFVQLATYSISLRVDEIFITDGLNWHHYKNVNSQNQKPVRELKIGDTHPDNSLDKIAIYLIQHLDAALIVPETPQIDELADKIENLELKVADLEKTLSLNSTTQSASGQPQTATFPTRSSSEWQELQQGDDYQGKKPRKLRLPDGREVPVGGWSSVLVECCRFALEQKPSLGAQIPIPNSAGKQTSLISGTKPPKERGGSSIDVNGSSYWIDTNYSANGTVANIFYILDKIPNHVQNVAVVL